ncbi:hypothetical protein [Chelatococcus reniformis]|uniref:Uncharacterized protein n=1 Tax=Chelatococcus reniformis TaxID=1494448 RepID=A0A916U5X7_9HYPH|nr:hypothetical protein [Chelatococcus reniformis]GGC61435.1 hypothetical protein GCM10010994_20000 [Chelatococcus reniformis]
MSKHRKTAKPTDADLKGNPMIGGSKGAAQVPSGELDLLGGATTIEGDVANDSNAHGGVDKAAATGHRVGTRR